jgi:drug/metabolite transporter (DMT)-like permease
MASAKPGTAALVAAFAAVYVIWGSTYLGIRFAVEAMPPFLMASARWIVAGVALYAWRRAAGDARPLRLHWRSAAIIGGLLILGGNGLVSYAEQTVESHLAALLIAIVPVYIALLSWGMTGDRPAWRAMAGIALGLAGVGVLVLPGFFAGGAHVAAWGLLIILLASFLWSAGSLYSRKAPLPESPLLGASMEMIMGGLLLALVGLATGEASRVDLAAVTPRAWIAVAFLTVFGSIVAYSAYVWLLQVSRPELVATYAFVNPIVAVALGVLLAGETVGATTLLAAVLIVAAVAIVVTAPTPRKKDAEPVSAE